MRKPLLLLFVFILLAVPVLAQPPVTSVFSGDTGLEIRYPIISYVQQSTDMSLHFHIFNKSNGEPVLNETTQCHFHLYNSTGNHVLRLENLDTISDTFDFEAAVGGGNFSDIGRYSYIFQCNDSVSGVGGFVSHSLEVTKTGFDNDERVENTSFLIVFLIFLFITVLVVVGVVLVKKAWLRVVLAVALNIMLMTLLRFGSWFVSITNPAETNLINTLDHFYSFSVYSLYFVVAGAMLFLIVMIFNALKDWGRNKKEEEWERW